MDGVNLTTAGWIVVAVLILVVLAVGMRYFISVAVELTRVLLVAGGVLVVIFALWLLFGR